MAFNLIAQMQLQAPTNLGRITNQIRTSLKDITADVNIRIAPGTESALRGLNSQASTLSATLKTLSVNANAAGTSLTTLGRGFSSSAGSANQSAAGIKSVVTSVSQLSKTTVEATNATEEFGRAAGLAGRRFLGFSLVAGSIVGSMAVLKNSLGEAFKFEREFIKISQLGGVTKAGLAELNTEITRLSTNLGVSSKELIGTAVTLRQAGLSVKEVTSAMEVLAKTNLAPSFDNIKETTEGAIAVMAQFRIEAKDLEGALASANAVANAFAVESKDIITAVQRSGGAFRSVGGDLNEFIALFTSVRATTRESAETIATGLRTVFTRLQRRDTVEALKELGVNLRFTRQEAVALGDVDLENQFVGAYESVRRLSEGLKNIPGSDPRFSEIIEQLGGYRQISKVIPLLQEFTTAQKALNVAQSGFGSITTSAEEAQTTFLVKLQKVKEEFFALARTITSGNAFNQFLDTSLKLAKAFVSIADALTPLIPLLTTLSAIKLASNVSSFFTGVGSGLGGTAPKKLARGGIVPGNGSNDTTPAMLTPGEFVVNKKDAQAVGYDKLANIRKYATGGEVAGAPSTGQTFKVGNYDLSYNNAKWLYALTAAKDGGASLIAKNQVTLKKLLGPPITGADYTSGNDIFQKLGFSVNPRNGVVQSLTEFRNTLSENRTFLNNRTEAVKSGKYVTNGTLTLPFAGESVGYVASGLEGGEAGKVGRGALNAGLRTETLDIKNIGSKTNQTAKALLNNAGVKRVNAGVNVHILGSRPTTDFATDVNGEIQKSIQNVFINKFGIGKVAPISKAQTDGLSGYMFEKYIEGLSGKFTAGNLEAFEYTRTNPGATLGKAFNKFVFPSPVNDTFVDLKNTFSRGATADVVKKYLNVKSRDGGLASILSGMSKTGNVLRAPGSLPANNKPDLRLATGGVVPGSGNGDTVPAKLTPGEFVIKKSSAQAIGYGKLESMNAFANGGRVQHFAAGGPVRGRSFNVGYGEDSVGLVARQGASGPTDITFDYNDISRRGRAPGPIQGYIDYLKQNKVPAREIPNYIRVNGKVERSVLNEKRYSEFESKVVSNVRDDVNNIFTSLPALRGGNLPTLSNQALSTIIGPVFELYISRLTGATQGYANSNFDFPGISKADQASFNKIFAPKMNAAYIDAKSTSTLSSAKDVVKKGINEGIYKTGAFTPEGVTPVIRKFASGGNVGDTVPAMLTPGEYVLNKGAASQIGLASLNHMNTTGKVQGFATGGPVNQITSSKGYENFSGGQITIANPAALAQFVAYLETIVKQAQALGNQAAKGGDASKAAKFFEEADKAQVELAQLTAGLLEFETRLKSLGQTLDKNSTFAIQKTSPDNALGSTKVLDATTAGQKTTVELEEEKIEKARKAAEKARIRQEEQQAAKLRDVGSDRLAREEAANRAAQTPTTSSALAAKELAARRVGSSTAESPELRAAQTAAAAGNLSQKSLEQVKAAEAQRNAANADKLAKEEEKIKKELIAAERRRIQAVNANLPKAEALAIAEQNVANALALGSKVFRDVNGKAIGLELAMGSTTAALRLTQAQIQFLGASAGLAANNIANGGADPSKGKGGGFLGGLKDKASGAGLLALTLGASYGSQIFDTKQSDFDNAAVDASRASTVTRNSGISNGLTTAAGGAAIGSLFGPIGSAIGAATGAIYGYTEGVKDAEQQIRSAKISKALTEFTDELGKINKNNLQLTDTRRSFIAERIGSITSGADEKARAEATGTLGSFKVGEYLNIRDKELRQTLGKELPELFELLNRESAKLGEGLAKSSKDLSGLDSVGIKAEIEKLDANFIAANRALLEPIAQLKKVSVETLVATDFRRSRQQGFTDTRTANISRTNAVDIGQQLNSFERLASNVESAVSAMKRLESVTSNLNDAFDGVIGTTLPVFEKNLAKLVGGGSSEDFNAQIGGLRNAFGGGASDLVDYAQAFDSVKTQLRSALTNTLSNGLLDEKDVGIKVREQIAAALTGGGTTKLTAQQSAILGSATNAINSKSPQDLKTGARASLDKVINEILSESAAGIESLSRIDESASDNAVKFVNELGKQQLRLQKIGEQEDRVAQARLSRLRNDAQQRAEALGRRSSPIDLLTINQLQAPQNQRAERLTGNQGIGQNPEAIAANLRALNVEIEKATRAQQASFDNDKLRSGASRDAANNLANLKKQSADYQTALKELTDTTNRNAAAQEKLNAIEQDRASRSSFGEKFLRGDAGERAEIARGLRLANVAQRQGNLNNFNPGQIRQVLDTLGSLGNAKLTGFGGARANDIRDRLVQNTVGGVFGIDKESQKEKKDLDKIIAENFAKAERAQQELLTFQKDVNTKLIDDLRNLQVSFFKQFDINAKKEEVTKLKQEETNLKVGGAEKFGPQQIAKNSLAAFGIKDDATINALKNNDKSVQAFIAVNQQYKDALKNREKETDTSDFVYGFNTPKTVGGVPISGNTVDSDKLAATISSYIDRKTGGNLDRGNLDAIVKQIIGKTTEESLVGTEVKGDIPETVRQYLEAIFSNRLNDISAGKTSAVNTLTGAGISPDVLAKIGAAVQSPNGLNVDEFNKSLNAFTKDAPLSKLTASIEANANAINAVAARLREKESELAQLKYGASAGADLGFGATVKRAAGGPIFKAVGTDTVPAMLTPGEYVVNAKAAASNRALLEQINSGKTSYFAEGGAVRKAAVPGSYRDIREKAIARRQEEFVINSYIGLLKAKETSEKARQAYQANPKFAHIVSGRDFDGPPQQAKIIQTQAQTQLAKVRQLEVSTLQRELYINNMFEAYANLAGLQNPEQKAALIFSVKERAKGKLAYQRAYQRASNNANGGFGGTVITPNGVAGKYNGGYFANGGPVPGTGLTDSVPAMLTPGEFVVNRRAVKSVGVDSLQNINAQRFANGGLVGGNSGTTAVATPSNLSEFSQQFSNSTSILQSAIGVFNSSSAILSEALKNFPSTITGNFTHQMTVSIQGAEALAALQPELEQIAINKAKQVLNNYIKNNLPDAGQVQ